MSYNTFPNIKRPEYGGYTEGVYKPARRTETEANTLSVRPKAALARRRFTLQWGKLPQADYNTLKAFFRANAGTPFNFTPYGESAAILVVFSEDELSFTAQAVDTAASGALRWRGSVTLEQVFETEML